MFGEVNYMALTLAELCFSAEKDYGMTLIAGKNGTDNMVRWAHYIEGGEVPRFLRGYELVFTTGMENHDTGRLINFAEKLHEYGASGFVINLGPYVDKVPEVLIEYCDSVDLPLYTIPWETRIVDITYEFCHHIVADEKKSRTMADIFIYAITNPENEENYKPELNKKGFADGEDYCIAAVYISDNESGNKDDLERTVKYNIVRRLNNYSLKHSVFMIDRFTIVVCQGIDNIVFEAEMKKQADMLNEVFSTADVYIGVGPKVKDSGELSSAYKKTTSVLKLAKSNNSDFMSYSQTGVYKLLMSVENKRNLAEYCNECLGKLAEYDRRNKTDYLGTLRLYLENDSSIAEVARITYVHRNTVNYKIKKIKEILGCELTQKDKLELMLAFMAEKLIGTE